MSKIKYWYIFRLDKFVASKNALLWTYLRFDLIFLYPFSRCRIFLLFFYRVPLIRLLNGNFRFFDSTNQKSHVVQSSSRETGRKSDRSRLEATRAPRLGGGREADRDSVGVPETWAACARPRAGSGNIWGQARWVLRAASPLNGNRP